MKSVSSPLILVCLLLSVIAGGGCEQKPQREITPIAGLSSLEQNKELVYVKGIVRDRAPLLNRSVYELEDTTGKIWVVTTTSPPESGQTVTIEAKIQTQSITLHNQPSEEVYLLQTQLLSQKIR